MSNVSTILVVGLTKKTLYLLCEIMLNWCSLAVPNHLDMDKVVGHIGYVFMLSLEGNLMSNL